MKKVTSAPVVDLAQFKRSKAAKLDLARGREPLHTSLLDGRASGSPHLQRPEAADFGDRMQRIKMSLEKINQLMSELRKTSAEKHQD